MKKKIIILGIILVSSLSLLLVMFCVKTKDIKYISSNEIKSYSNITMTVNGIEVSTAPTSGYYKLQAQCENGSVSWSNISNKLKVKVTNSPLKCTLAFTEVTEDINMVAITIEGVESSTVPSSGNYIIDYNCVDENNISLSGAALPVITWSNDTHKLTTSNISKKIFCTIDFTSAYRKIFKVVNSKGTNGGKYLTNIAPDNSFENSQWTSCQDETNAFFVRYGSKSCKMSFDSSIIELRTYNSTQLMLYNPQHRYYTAADYYAAYPGSSSRGPESDIYINITYYSNLGLYGSSKGGLQLTLNQWVRRGGIAYGFGPNGSQGLETIYSTIAIDANNSNTTGSQYVDGFTIIDLTTDYGNDNIPSDEYLNSLPFFERNLEIVDIYSTGEQVLFDFGSSGQEGTIYRSYTCTGEQPNMTLTDSGLLVAIGFENPTQDSDCTIIFR